MKLVTTEEFNTLNAEFSDWFDRRSLMFDIFGDSRGICKSIVMEYLANQQGMTIYKHIAEENK